MKKRIREKQASQTPKNIKKDLIYKKFGSLYAPCKMFNISYLQIKKVYEKFSLMFDEKYNENAILMRTYMTNSKLMFCVYVRIFLYMEEEDEGECKCPTLGWFVYKMASFTKLDKIKRMGEMK